MSRRTGGSLFVLALLAACSSQEPMSPQDGMFVAWLSQDPPRGTLPDATLSFVPNHAVRIASQGQDVRVASYITNEEVVWPGQRGSVDWPRVEMDLVVSAGSDGQKLQNPSDSFVKQAIRDACIGLQDEKLDAAQVKFLPTGSAYVADVRCNFFRQLDLGT